jgi:hypothetical protein
LDLRLQLGDWELNHLHLLFLFSGALQILVLLLLTRVQETGAAGARTVLLQLRNDLDPQTGIASATDFVTVRATKTSRVFEKVDTKTDDWAARCEVRMAKVIDTIYKRFRAPLRFCWTNPLKHHDYA